MVLELLELNKSRLKDTSLHEDNTVQLNQLAELEETINILTNDIQALQDSSLQRNNKLLEYSGKLQELTDYVSQVKFGVEEQCGPAESNAKILGKLHQAWKKLEKTVEEMRLTWYDGTLIWKITGFREKMSKYSSTNYHRILSHSFSLSGCTI